MQREQADRRREEALARFAAERRAVEGESARPAGPGDLFVLPEAAAWPVEWAVVGAAPEEPERLLAVAADTHPLAGSGDVAVAGDEPGGPLTLRCRFGAVFGREDLPSSRRSGKLSARVVGELVRKCAEVLSGTLAASDQQEEADTSPEYREWMREVVEPAWRAVAVRAGAAGELPTPATAAGTPVAPHAAAEEGARALAFGRRREREERPAEPRSSLSSSRWLGLAASVLLAVSLALGGGVVVQSRRLAEVEGDRLAAEEGLRAEIRSLGEARERDAREHHLEVERLTREAAGRREAAAGPAAAEPRPLVNVPFAWLRPEAGVTRGEAPPVQVGAGAGPVFLILPIDDPGPFQRFRLEILREATGRRVWETDGLVRTGLAEASVSLPGSLLPAGDYVLHLSGLEPGEPRPVATYRLRIAAE